MVKSQQFLGVAQMTSDFDPKDSFKYWWEECKWFGSFTLKWIYVKDVREKQFEHIREYLLIKPIFLFILIFKFFLFTLYFWIKYL